MNAQLWALIGVVVGAVLGALAQLVSDQLRSSRDRAHRNETVRREAYVQFIGSVWGAKNYALGFVQMLADEMSERIPDPHVLDPEVLKKRTLDRVFPALSTISRELDHALGTVLLVGPDEVSERARAVESFIWKRFTALCEHEDDAHQELQRLVEAFTAAAQKHSGLSSAG